MNINENRKIKIYLTDSTTSTWRTNLSRIMSSNSKRSGIPLFNLGNGSETDVNNQVDLIMSTAPKSPATQNNLSYPVKSVLDSFNKSGAITSIISSVASYGIDILSAYNDVFASGGNSTNRTALIFQPWTKNVQNWAGADKGIAFEYEFSFAMGQYGLWNAKEEVIKPIFNLIAPAFPQYLSDFGMAGPFPSSAELLMRLFTGGSLDTISNNFSSAWGNITSNWTGTTTKNGKEEQYSTGNYTNSYNTKSLSGKVMNSLESIAKALSSLVTATYKNLTFTIEFGNVFRFDNMIILDASTTFSNEVDNYGYPVSGTAKITFSGLLPLALKNNASMGKSQMFSGSMKDSLTTRYGE